MKRCIKSTRLVFLKNLALRARSLSLRQPQRSPGEERAGGSLRRKEAGEKFKKARFRYLLLFIIQSKKRTQKRPFYVLRGLKQKFYMREKSKNENSYSG